MEGAGSVKADIPSVTATGYLLIIFCSNMICQRLFLPVLQLRVQLSDCMGVLYRFIVACAHLGNSTGSSTGSRTVTPLLLTGGLVKYEVGLN